MGSTRGSEGSGREERGRLLLCWNHEPARGRKSMSMGVIGTHALAIGTRCRGLPAGAFGRVTLGSEWLGQ
eukprot:scaffold2697_cov346-Pavlova_lutheri.AAC.9